MLRTERLDQATAPDGTTLVLFRHGRDYFIRVGTVELMSTRRHHSEEQLAELCCAPIADRSGARVLIGGLGFGFTLRTALSRLPADAEIVVAELVDRVIEWNRDPAYGLAGDALEDPRVRLRHQDVAELLGEERHAYDAILLDVDNGAEVLTHTGNVRLYGKQGIRLAVDALRPGGYLGYWSADDDPVFEGRLRRAGLDLDVVRVRAHATAGPKHTLFIGRMG